jgi:hypothetical protein
VKITTLVRELVIGRFDTYEQALECVVNRPESYFMQHSVYRYNIVVDGKVVTTVDWFTIIDLEAWGGYNTDLPT